MVVAMPSGLRRARIPARFFPSAPGSSPCANIRPETVMAVHHARFYVLAGDWSKGGVKECRGPSPADRTRHGAPADRMRDGANVKVACATWRPTPMRWRLGADGKGECLGIGVGSGGCPAADSRADPAAGKGAGGGGRMDRAGPQSPAILCDAARSAGRSRVANNHAVCPCGMRLRMARIRWRSTLHNSHTRSWTRSCRTTCSTRTT